LGDLRESYPQLYYLPEFIFGKYGCLLCISRELSGCPTSGYHCSRFRFFRWICSAIAKSLFSDGKRNGFIGRCNQFWSGSGRSGFFVVKPKHIASLDSFCRIYYSCFSALRLAKFNIDERQTTSFIGLPTPANALFWVGLGYSFPDF